ncbi:hypothetical protein, partial [Streptococcus pseudopneumoniae]
YTDDQDESDATLQIFERFGFNSKTEVFTGSVLQASGGQSLLAVLDGKVEVKGQLGSKFPYLQDARKHP